MSKHSTDMLMFTVKILMKYFCDQYTPVYTCLLDASKAFDRVSHWTLFAKLFNTQAPLLIVSVLLFWYQMKMFAKNGAISRVHNISLFAMACDKVEFSPLGCFPCMSII